jgi:hypothetical protein
MESLARVKHFNLLLQTLVNYGRNFLTLGSEIKFFVDNARTDIGRY